MKPRILCVDDDLSILSACRRQLRKRFHVETATGGFEGLNRLREDEPYDVVVTDMRMPGMSGVEFLRQARIDSPDTIRVMLTGNADLDTVMNAVNEGEVFRFLRKPCGANVLAEALLDAVSNRRERSSKSDDFCHPDKERGTQSCSHDQVDNQQADWKGRTLGEYEVLHEIGRGGIGAIYKARHAKLGSIVAVKLLSHRFMHDAVAKRRFEREMQLVAELDHPNIVRALDAREVDGILFLVMEFVNGVDLAQIMSRKRADLRVEDCVAVVRQAALGLQHAHERGIIHRDLKPANLMLAQTPAGLRVKILDFGLARLQGATASTLSSAGQMLGTVDYMAPEQVAGEEGIDIRTDIYALGATLYELLSGRPPFGDEAHGSIIKKLVSAVSGDFPALSTLRPGISKNLADIVTRMLANSKVDRFCQPIDLATALADFTGGADLTRLLDWQRPLASAVRTASGRSRAEVSATESVCKTMELPALTARTK